MLFRCALFLLKRKDRESAPPHKEERASVAETSVFIREKGRKVHWHPKGKGNETHKQAHFCFKEMRGIDVTDQFISF